MSTIDIDFLKAIKDPLLLKRIHHYSIKATAPYKGSSLSIFINPHDIASEAIEQVLSGTRPWNKDKYPDEPFIHVAGCIRSIISKYSTRKESSTVENYETHNEFQGNGLSPEDEALLSDIRKITLEFKEIVNGKAPELMPIVVAMIEKEIYCRRELANFLDTSAKDIDNQRARIKRLYTKHILTRTG